MEPGHGTRLRELAVLFGTLGVIGFGGPAAHVALMRREVVERRGWLDDRALVDMIGITSVIPGPNSTELAMLVGQRRAGVAGLLVAGVAFILPAAVIVGLLAWAYVTWGSTPTAAALLYGVKPVIVAVVIAALVPFARIALGGPLSVALGLVAAGLWLLGVNELALLAGAAVAMAVARLGSGGSAMTRGAIVGPAAAAAGLGTAASINLAVLAAVFLKAGALLFGSGYVLVAYLRGDLVQRLGWLTDAQLLDAVAIGQVTPGPLFTTATFIGYLLAGVPGALVATVAIFLPAFVLAGLVAGAPARARERPLTAALLDGLNAAAIGLMAAVTLHLGLAAVVDPLTAALGAAALLALLLRAPSVLVVLAGAAAGLGAAAASIGPGSLTHL